MNNSIERRKQAKWTFHRIPLETHHPRAFLKKKKSHYFLRFFLFFSFLFSLGFYISIVQVGSIVLDTNRIEIPPWETLSTLIDNKPFKDKVAPWRYRYYLRFIADVPSVVKSWIYPVDKTATISEFITKTLSASKPIEAANITILPGWNIYDIDAYLTKRWYIASWDLISSQANLALLFSAKYPFLRGMDSLEGFLYPDTHEIADGSALETIVMKLLEGFHKKIYQNLSDAEKKTVQKDIILASILQKEERNPANYIKVASVLKTRLKNNIALWADATTCYAYKITSSECTPNFIGSHIREINEYNTRTLRWLPRWPISNVTADIYRASLDASDKSEYLYYLHDNDWVLRLSRNLEEHNAKVQQYLR